MSCGYTLSGFKIALYGLEEKKFNLFFSMIFFKCSARANKNHKSECNIIQLYLTTSAMPISLHLVPILLEIVTLSVNLAATGILRLTSISLLLTAATSPTDVEELMLSIRISPFLIGSTSRSSLLPTTLFRSEER